MIPTMTLDHAVCRWSRDFPGMQEGLMSEWG
jgi:hypothetical protein